MRFPAKKYLEHYYKEIGSENQRLIDFYAKVKTKTSKNAIHLEIGGGPTIYQLVSLANEVSKIIHIDISRGALNQVKYWIQNLPNSFNWSHFINSSLIAEGIKNPSKLDIETRAKLLRKKFHKLIRRDLSDPLIYIALNKRYGPFHSISANFSLEAITTEFDVFKELIKELYLILASGGRLNLVVVEECNSYQIGNNYIPTLNIGRDQIIKILTELGFKEKNIEIEFEDTENEEYGYKGIMFITCKKT